jgi:CheY-like chemotaxis protein
MAQDPGSGTSTVPPWLRSLSETAQELADDLRRSVSAANVIIGRLSSFELSIRPVTPDQEHRIELLQDAREAIATIASITDRLGRLANRDRPGEPWSPDAVPLDLAQGSGISRLPTEPAEAHLDDVDDGFDDGFDDQETTGVHAPGASDTSRILIILDERSDAASLALELGEHDVTVASTACEAIEIIERDDHFDLVVTALSSAGCCGLEAYAEACMMAPEVAAQFVFVVAPASEGHATELLRATRHSYRLPELLVGSRARASDVRALLARRARLSSRAL